MKAGTVALFAALMASLAACGSRTDENRAASQNVLPAPVEPANNTAASDNVVAANVQAMGPSQPETPARQTEPQRTPPAQKAEPERPTQPADPHAGHDMGNMTHNASSGGS